MECAEHTEPGFLQDEVSPASCITLWFDGKLQGHTAGTGEGTSTSSCPKGALEGQGPLPGQGLGRQHPPPVQCGSCSPPPWKTSPASKRLSNENHFWQPLGNGRCPLTAPLLASAVAVTVLSRRRPVVSPPARTLLPVQQRATARAALALLGKPARGPFPSALLCLLPFWPGMLEIWVLERSLPERCRAGGPAGHPQNQPHRWGASALAVTRGSLVSAGGTHSWKTPSTAPGMRRRAAGWNPQLEHSRG